LACRHEKQSTSSTTSASTDHDIDLAPIQSCGYGAPELRSPNIMHVTGVGGGHGGRRAKNDVSHSDVSVSYPAQCARDLWLVTFGALTAERTSSDGSMILLITENKWKASLTGYILQMSEVPVMHDSSVQSRLMYLLTENCLLSLFAEEVPVRDGERTRYSAL
jgi:hypothetical protein